jgi:hypothetical protein
VLIVSQIELEKSELLGHIASWFNEAIALLMCHWDDCEWHRYTWKLTAASTPIKLDVDVEDVVITDVFRMASWSKLR